MTSKSRLFGMPSCDAQHTLAAASLQHVVEGAIQRVHRIAVAYQPGEFQLALRDPFEQSRKIPRGHAAAIQRRKIALVPEQVGEFQRGGTVRATYLQRIAAVARQLERQK